MSAYLVSSPVIIRYGTKTSFSLIVRGTIDGSIQLGYLTGFQQKSKQIRMEFAILDHSFIQQNSDQSLYTALTHSPKSPID